MFETPDISHLKAKDYEHVYEPAEDTFLLLDALQKDYAFIQKIRPTLCIEVGCGSGTVTSFVSKLLGSSAHCLATDINGHATLATMKTALQNRQSPDVIQMDLATSFLPRLHGQVDLILFNPPYVVTPSQEPRSVGLVHILISLYQFPCVHVKHNLLKVGISDITSSWAGGVNGMEVTNRFLPCVCKLLSTKSAFYMVAVKENKIDKIEQQMLATGLMMEEVLKRNAGPERLFILKFTRIM
ncbi:methyltransferase N6AMT1-like isoform X1 [Antedon mediterranea]|uniref:methyltransferase N6AMT1-like isoform X1 n=1 Tax=Antedon mediterranea TaxID=105859 RepID=UPI003AF8483A